MEFMESAMDESCVHISEEKRPCKNLEAERRRRKKLSDRLLALRSVVPIITDMTRATIIKDAITYIHELKSSVDLLTQELLQIDATPPVAGGEVAATNTGQCEADDVEEIKPLLIKEENVVEVNKISEKKLWIKIIMEKKKGRFSKLLEAMARVGFELTDTTATTCKGIMLFSSFVQGTNDTLTVEQTKEHLLQMVRGI